MAMQHLTVDEFKQLLGKIPNERKRLMFVVGFFHGLRVSELIGLTKESIADGYINVQRLKGSLKTIQPYIKHPDPELDEYTMLAKLYGTLKKKERLFPWTRDGAFKMMQRAGAAAGLPKHKCHPHSLKHSCAMLAIKKIGIESVRQYLGHKSLSSTGAYLRVSDGEASAEFAKSL
jgi:integrase